MFSPGRPFGLVCQSLRGFRVHRIRPQAILAVRTISSQAGDNKTGHINTGPNEGIFFFNGIFPLNFRWLLRLSFFHTKPKIPEVLGHMNNLSRISIDPKIIIERALPEGLPLKVTEIINRVKEGGSYVKFAHDPELDVAEIEGTLQDFLKSNPVKLIYSPWRRVRARLVLGKPWIEDLNRFPSPKLKVEFTPTAPGREAAELSQETLYSLFRKYGKIADIVSQPPDSKILPKYSILYFRLTRQAIMANNCMHGFTLPETAGGGKTGTVLKLGYVPVIKAHWIRDWLASHPRIVIPIVAALIATMTVAIFDPIRTFFIKSHISQAFHITDNIVYQWIRSELSRANDILSFRSRRAEDPGLTAIWDDRKNDIQQIQSWLMETADTFIIVQGPRGSGKKELVLDRVLKGRKNNLVIDCKPIQEANGDSATIYAAATEVGYRPVFSWMNSISSLIDLAAQGAIGTKTGFSQTLDAQLAKIWQNTATALKELALEGRRTDDKDANLSNDEYLEAHPERRPVVVIDSFLHKANESGVVYDKISEWAAGLTTANIAHVIFLTNDVSFSKSLSKALPGRVFRQISLGDCSPEVAKRFVINHLDSDSVEKVGSDNKVTPSATRHDLSELDGCIEILGGRLTDLEFLARRIKAGETPKQAVNEIIEQSASEILKMYILDLDRSPRKWSAQAAWYLIKALTSEDQIRYNEVLLSDLYKTDGEADLQAMEQAELITIISSNGRPHSIKPGKPVYRAAFRRLVEDKVLKSRLDLAILSELTAIETKNIGKYEAELGMLGSLPNQPRAIVPRIEWLLAKLQASQAKVDKYERESELLKMVLQNEY